MEGEFGSSAMEKRSRMVELVGCERKDTGVEASGRWWCFKLKKWGGETQGVSCRGERRRVHMFCCLTGKQLGGERGKMRERRRQRREAKGVVSFIIHYCPERKKRGERGETERRRTHAKE